MTPFPHPFFSYQFLDAKGDLLYDNSVELLASAWQVGAYAGAAVDPLSGVFVAGNVVVNFELPKEKHRSRSRASPGRGD